MNRFWQNVKKYKNYAIYSATASMKSDVSESYFNWLWWILDPFLFMLVYSFVANIVFGHSEPHFIPFVFIGHGAWTFFSSCISKSVRLVRWNKGILSRIYLPKYILVISMLIEGIFRYLITVALCVIVAIIDGVHFTPVMLWFPLVAACMAVLTFGLSCLMTHVGVYAKDMTNIVTVILRLMFYLSGIFYNIGTRAPAWVVRVNPMACFISELRNVFLYGKAPNFKWLLIWTSIGLVVSALGIHLIHKHEQTYVKSI